MRSVVLDANEVPNTAKKTSPFTVWLIWKQACEYVYRVGLSCTESYRTGNLPMVENAIK